MLILDSTLRKLEIVLAGAITTNQLPFVASYVDITPTTFTPATNDSATNSTTAVDMVVAPPASTQRQLKFVNVYNADTVAANVTIRFNDNGTTRILVKTSLNSGDTLQFMDTEGWSVISNNGQVKLGLSSRQFYSATTAGPTTGIANTTGLMTGLGGAITPQGSGVVLVILSGYSKNTTNVAGDGCAGTMRYGTGTAPTNGAALTGTAFGSTFETQNERAVVDLFGFCVHGIITGLTIGTPYWLDLALATLVGGTAQLGLLSLIAIEL
jgi:hypothetical protein